MSTIQFSNGHTVEFNGTPTQQDIEQLGVQMGLHQIQSEQKQPNFLQRIGSNISSAFKSGIQQTKEGFQQSSNSGGNPLTATEGAVKMGAGIVNTLASPFAPLSKPVGTVINTVSDKVGNIPAVQRFSQTTTGQNVARGAEDIANLSTLAGGIAGGMETPKAAATVNDVTGTALKGAKEFPGVVKTNAADFYKNQSLKDWRAPTKTPKGYIKANKIFQNAASRGNNIPDVLVNNGIKLSDTTQKGIYNTSDAASALREDTGKISGDLLRPSLEVANYSTPKIPVIDVMRNALESIKKNNSMTLTDKQSMVSKLNKENNLLKQQYPEGMSLTDLHDNKITYSKNAGHNPVGTRADNLISNTNNAIAQSLKDTLEKTAPKEVPVKEVNAELSKRYQAADYLDALHGKSVPKGLGSKIAQTTAKVVGAGVGESLGGGLLAGVGGYHLGGLIERFIENSSNPVKAHFLNNLQKTNPEAFSKVSEYLGQQETNRLLTKQLPAGSAKGTSSNPIISPDPRQFNPNGTLKTSTTRIIPAKKNLVTTNPKSGRFQKTYNSDTR